MNGWHSTEQQAQINYGRNQLAMEEQISHRPIGYMGGNAAPHQKARQFGGFENRRPQNHSHHSGGENRERGHMAFLKALQRSSAKVRIVSILGEEIIGFLKDCDETTISLRVPCANNGEAYQNRVFVKHNIVEFAPVIEGVTFS